MKITINERKAHIIAASAVAFLFVLVVVLVVQIGIGISRNAQIAAAQARNNELREHLTQVDGVTNWLESWEFIEDFAMRELNWGNPNQTTIIR